MLKFEPGTQVDLMRGGQWEGPFIVTDKVGRTPEHLVLRNPENGVLFEEHVDDYSLGYQIRLAEKQDDVQAIMELIYPDPWGQAEAADARARAAREHAEWRHQREYPSPDELYDIRFGDDGEYPGDDSRD